MSNELDATLSAIKCSSTILFIEETGHTLADRVARKIQDGSYTWVEILDEFNNCLIYLSGKYDLPNLEHYEDVLTGTSNQIPMPANFQKNLWQCRSITHNRPVTVHETVIEVFRRYSVLDQNGVVRDVAVQGRNLVYQRIPSGSETLRLFYYRYPERLRTLQDKPTCLPDHLIERLLVNYACKEIFSEIEDGVDGKQVNAQRYEDRFNKAETVLALTPGIKDKRMAPVEIPDEMQWNAYV